MNEFLRDFVWPLIKRLIKLICVGPITFVAPWVFGFAIISLQDLLFGRRTEVRVAITCILGAIGLVGLYSSILLPRGFVVLSRAYRVACLIGLGAGIVATILIVEQGPIGSSGFLVAGKKCRGAQSVKEERRRRSVLDGEKLTQ
jgi:hypothetical protein